MLSQETDGSIIGPFHDTIDLFINERGRLLAVFAGIVCQGSAGEWVFTITEGDGTEPFAHTPTGNHLARNGCDTLELVPRSCRYVPYGRPLGGAAAKSGHQLRLEVILRVVVAIVQRCILRDAKGLSTRHNRDLGDRVDVFLQQSCKRMATFVVRDDI